MQRTYEGLLLLLQALDMGLINTVVPLEKLEEETAVWCREILRNSPTALRVLKAALNAAVSYSTFACFTNYMKA